MTAAPVAIEEIAAFEKTANRAEDLGLSLAEGKALLAAAQQHLVQAQVDLWLEGIVCGSP